MDWNAFKWTNETNADRAGDRLLMAAHPKSDLFVNASDGSIVSNAAFFYTEVSGDFVLRAKVTHDFLSVYDACALLFYSDERHWGKIALEYTDNDTHAVISVITNEVSDDAVGNVVENNTVWLQLAKKDNMFAMHYSADGSDLFLHRFFTVPHGKTLHVGFSAQSPLGEGGNFIFEDISLETRTLTDLRKGK